MGPDEQRAIRVLGSPAGRLQTVEETFKSRNRLSPELEIGTVVVGGQIRIALIVEVRERQVEVSRWEVRIEA